MSRLLVRGCVLAAVATVAAVAGCAPRERIPTYPQMNAQQALDTIQRRATHVRDVAGEGALTLVDAKGNSARLDAAFVLAPPDRARVRAWKFGQAVFDMTILPEAVWLYAPREDRAEQVKSAACGASQAMREWLGLLAGAIDAPGASRRTTDAEIIVTRPAAGGQSLVCRIDRRTLTPRRYALLDAGGRERFSLVLDRYESLGQTVWPSRVQARSENGRVTIEMRDVELNAAPPGAFKPPVRAERLQ